jgi:hypothetical protein
VDTYMTGTISQVCGTDPQIAARSFLARLTADPGPALTKIICAGLWQPRCDELGGPVSAWDAARLRAGVIECRPQAPHMPPGPVPVRWPAGKPGPGWKLAHAVPSTPEGPALPGSPHVIR